MKLDRSVKIFRLSGSISGNGREYLNGGNTIKAAFRDLSMNERERDMASIGATTCRFTVNQREIGQDCYVEVETSRGTEVYAVMGTDRFEDKKRTFMVLHCNLVANPESDEGEDLL